MGANRQHSIGTTSGRLTGVSQATLGISAKLGKAMKLKRNSIGGAVERRSATWRVLVVGSSGNHFVVGVRKQLLRPSAGVAPLPRPHRRHQRNAAWDEKCGQ